MGILAIRILVGHLVGDFLLQTKTTAKRKQTESRYLFIHVGLVFLSMMLCTIGFRSPPLILSLMIISLLHLTDSFKSDEENRLHSFFREQALHLMSIAIIPALCGVWHLVSLFEAVGILYNDARLWIYILGYIIGVWVSSFVIGEIIMSIRRRIYKEGVPLSPIGREIGIVERLLIMTLALLNQYIAIGFVFAIKGIARKVYAENSESSGEIYFLGTGLSFFVAIITVLGIQVLLM